MNKKDKDRGEELQERVYNMQHAREEFGVEVGEDATKYGEFISSYFAWISLPEQKQKAKELENITKKNNSKTSKLYDKKS